ncbi:hypothetical protein [Gulosibacter sp. ACHW.36C]|uniref:Uncharacterized protein n=1 Tax=Gulosibacter sediminis TaxID=1729695 RepID=A0ABY4MXW6_9MICO|nr:hypothetical protein [Gulosibacter sediminis]UQN15234.1 hypothetical protein M3M28_01815 [Gulosibacter sediminis]
MIRYDEVADLEGEQAIRVRALIDRSSAIWDMPLDRDTADAWEQQVADCEAEGVPHLAASARYGQYSLFSQSGKAQEALEAYARLMQIIARYGDHLHPENLATFLESISTVASTLVDDPRIPRAQLEQVVGLVEAQIRERGLDLGEAFLAKAELSADFGDRDATLQHLNEWLTTDNDYWQPGSPYSSVYESSMLVRVDPQLALRTLEQRLAGLGVGPGPLDPNHPELAHLVSLRARQGVLYARAGQRAVAAQIGDELREQFELDSLIDEIEAQDLLVVLEHRRDEAEEFADHLLTQLYLDETNWRTTAAVARVRVLADPANDEGWLLFKIAEDAAELHDERGGVATRHLDELREFWLEGLPHAPKLDIVDDAAVWGDPQARAEHILQAGWLPRQTHGVSIDGAPVSMNERYYESISAVQELSEESTQPELVDKIIARAQELRLTTVVFGTLFVGAMQHAVVGENRAMLEGLARTQRLRLDDNDAIEPGVRAAGEGGYVEVVHQALGDPEVSIDSVAEFITREHEVRAKVGGSTSQLALGQAEVAAQLGNVDALKELLTTFTRWLEHESEQVDEHKLLLQAAGLVAPFSPDYTAALASQVLDETHDAEHRRAALAWVAWRELQDGRAERVPEVVASIEEIDRDLSEFGSVPDSVLVQLAETDPDELAWVVEAALDNVDYEGAPVDIDIFATAAHFLLTHRPDDPRGPQFRDEAQRIAAELDARNGNSFQSWRLHTQWLRDAQQQG